MYIAAALLVAVVGIWLFFRLYPAFGGRTPARLKRRSSHFRDGRFINLEPTVVGVKFGEMWGMLRDLMRRDTARRPERRLTPVLLDDQAIPNDASSAVWFGHSAFLVRLADKHILFDPMFGVSPSPFPAVTGKRFSDELPALPEDLPDIDAVIISHDHYDHLDYPSIKRLRGKVRMFFVPLGVGAHLRRWGVASNAITELDWGEESVFDRLHVTCTPARHFSGRTLTDRWKTLWASWVVRSGNTKIFFSGDGGYGSHFAEIGRTYGPFDLTLIECGQYDDRWAHVHMTPEQTVQAHRDLRGKVLIPMHWGAFVLAFHAWNEPVKRAVAAARKAGVVIATPQIGELVRIGKPPYPTTPWWDRPAS